MEAKIEKRRFRKMKKLTNIKNAVHIRKTEQPDKEPNNNDEKVQATLIKPVEEKMHDKPA